MRHEQNGLWIVLGRKNHYGSRSVRGTEVAALFYTLIESAKLAGVGPHTYLQAAINAAVRGAQIPLPHEGRWAPRATAQFQASFKTVAGGWVPRCCITPA